MAKLLFSSGFNGVSLSAPYNPDPSEAWASVVGTDSVTGFSWPGSLWGGGMIIQMLSDGGNPSAAVNGQIETEAGPNGTPVQALHLAVTQKVTGITQDPLLIEPATSPTDFYVSEWVKLPSNLAQILGPTGWLALGAEWKTAGDFRAGAAVTEDGNGNLNWEMKWDTNANGTVPLQTFWDSFNTNVAVPVGQWMHLESYTHRDATAGETWLKVNAQTVFDHVGDDIGQNDAPINRIFLANPYANNPVGIDVTNIQIWDGIPTAAQAAAAAPVAPVAPVVPVVPTVPVAPVASARDLHLIMSEDRWIHNAQFDVMVDGTQVGGTNTVTARHSLGQTQGFDFSVTLAAGAHDIAVEFLNDAYGGSATKDVNLYVVGASLGGVALAGVPDALYNDGTHHYAVTLPA